jgi:hypothetical protein
MQNARAVSISGPCETALERGDRKSCLMQESCKPIHEGGEHAGMDQKIPNGRYGSQDQKPILHGRNSRKVICSRHYALGGRVLNPAWREKPRNW